MVIAKMNIKIGEENVKFLNRMTLVLNTCTDRIISGDTSLLDVCYRFEIIENKHFKQIFNESRTDIEKIVLGY